ncbi:MAG: hypothetical protein Q4G51_09345 [Dermatophilus congolensis]|nr:hypothetical protein [Dermatophilus congolensis]
MRRTICDLAAVNTDGGHLAEIVRDAVVSGKVQLGELADALSPYAHAYGAPEEDGRALLQQFLENAGVPVHIGEVAALTLDLTASAQTDKAQGEKVHDV